MVEFVNGDRVFRVSFSSRATFHPCTRRQQAMSRPVISPDKSVYFDQFDSSFSFVATRYTDQSDVFRRTQSVRRGKSQGWEQVLRVRHPADLSFSNGRPSHNGRKTINTEGTRRLFRISGLPESSGRTL